VTTLDLAGTIISSQIGLSSATIFNPALQSTGTLTGALLSLGGLVVIFETNLHHLLLEGVVDSYTLFRPTEPMPIGDFSDTMAKMIGASFKVGVQISMPFIVLSLLFTFALGLISRLMPTLQIFFVSVPVQLTGGFLILIVSLSAMIGLFLTYFTETMTGLLTPR
jgi:flagellar biosynthetic protein FliR